MNNPLTVGELIDQLSMYPRDIVVEMSMKIDVDIKAGNGNQVTFKEYAFPHGKVYGVQGCTGGHSEVVISGS